MKETFLLETKTAQHLYDTYAKDMPIVDYHCHLDPKDIAEDRHFENITQIWLYGDHYKWRFMRSMGIEEKYITGSADDFDRFKAWASAIGYAAGNPLYHWTQLELKRYFDIDEYLTAESAERIWEKTCEVIKGGDFTARKLIKRSNVELIGTTDDPADSLEYHKQIKEISDFDTVVVPTYRPDKAVNIELDGFAGYIKKLGATLKREISTYADLKSALLERMEFFCEMGCRAADHGMETVPYIPATDKEIDKIFKAVLKGKKISCEDIEKYKTGLLLFLAEEYSKHNIVLQLHMGVIRNNNTRIFKTLGADSGHDSVADTFGILKLSKLMDHLEQKNVLPKTILYSLNGKDNITLATLMGCFQGDEIAGKIQLGSAWWFLDNIDGMEAQIKCLANEGALASFVGMLTDSRSLLSYPRHEYFRRILCNVIGQWVEKEMFTNDEKILKTLIQNICVHNAERFFM